LRLELKKARDRFHPEPHDAQMAVAGKGVKEKGADGRFNSRFTCAFNTASTGEEMVVTGDTYTATCRRCC
jgi:hypothetical protein